uniref:Putative secreted protein n=1 Tax=Anopheles darlingi TaxID=43151 RepID=A0A2M4DPN3_ANODA
MINVHVLMIAFWYFIRVIRLHFRTPRFTDSDVADPVMWFRDCQHRSSDLANILSTLDCLQYFTYLF